MDTAFLSAEGVDEEGGFMVPDVDDAACKKAVMEKAAHAVLLADSSKIGKKSLVCYADFDMVDAFITDNKCDVSVLEKMRKKKARIIVA